MEITIMKLRESREYSTDDYINLFYNYKYNEDTGIGFKELNIEDDSSISGIVAKRTPVFFKIVDPITQNVVEQEQFIVSEIDFKIDTIFNFIEIYASPKDVRKVVTTFLQTVYESIELEQLNLKPSRVLESFKEDSNPSEITKLHIKDFSSQKGVIGSYDIKSIDPNLAWELVDEYRNEIVKATISIEEGNTTAIIQVFQNGKFKVSAKPRNNSHLIIYKVKNLISTNLQ